MGKAVAVAPKRKKKPLLNRIFTQMFYALVAWWVCIYVGAELFQNYENVRFIDAFYWAVQVATSTGPGDVAPKTDEGKILFIVYNNFVTVFLLLYLGANIVARVIKNSDLMSHNEQEWLFWMAELIYKMVAWNTILLVQIARKLELNVESLKRLSFQRADGSVPPPPPQPNDIGQDGDKWDRTEAEKVFRSKVQDKIPYRR